MFANYQDIFGEAEMAPRYGEAKISNSVFKLCLKKLYLPVRSIKTWLYGITVEQESALCCKKFNCDKMKEE